MKNFLLEIEYDGSGFSGWQKQPGRRTVQGEIESALGRVLKDEVSIFGASRTDAGVHAIGQAASFSGPYGIPADRIPIAVNPLLPGIRIKRAEERPEGFHARFDAVGKTYCYRIREAPEHDVFTRNYYCCLKNPLNLYNMNKAGGYIIGTHDFSSFRSAGGSHTESAVRTVYGIDVEERRACCAMSAPAREISLRITGNGFLYNMVRIIAGTLVEIGCGRKAPEEMGAILGAMDRRLAGPRAPASGLYLEKVHYDVSELQGGFDGQGR